MMQFLRERTAFISVYDESAALVAETAVNQFNKRCDCLLLVGAVSNDADCSTADNTQRKDAQQRLGIHAALFLLDPDCRAELICLLDKECSRACMETNRSVTHRKKFAKQKAD